MFRHSSRSLAQSRRCLGGLRATARLLAPSSSPSSSFSSASTAKKSVSRGRSAAQSSHEDASVPLPGAHVGRAAAAALGLSDTFFTQQEQQALYASSTSKKTAKGSRRLITPPAAAAPEKLTGPVDVEVALEEGEVRQDKELAALLAAHKARHGSIAPAPSSESASMKKKRKPSSFSSSSAAKVSAARKAAAATTSIGRHSALVMEEAEEENMKRAEMGATENYDGDEDGEDYGSEEIVAHAYVAAEGEEEEAATAANALTDGDAVADAVRVAARAKPKTSKKSKATAAVAAAAASALTEPAGLTILENGLGADPLSAAALVPSHLTNPFRGIHSFLGRSYRLDQLLDGATSNDMLFARQEKKSTAFSFLRFRGGKTLYEGHWGSLEDLRSTHQRQLFPGGFKDGTVADMFDKLRQGGIAVPGFSLFNNNLGLYDPRVESSFPLLMAQRLLLFPDSLRHFHALCGRENVPCDFFADVDLPDVSPEEGEKVLLEILNYLEVRLPGVGFTDPFFLVLTNAEPSKDKVSYHIHARSMTYQREESVVSLRGSGATAAKKKKAKASKKRRNNSSSLAETDVEADDDDDDADVYDDLSDLVNVVDGDGKKSASTPKVITFQDYRTVKLLGDEVNQMLGRTVIDDNCYRVHGMLRCAFSAKLASNQDVNPTHAGGKKRLVPLITAKDSALRQKLSYMEAVLRTMTDPEILELSFCNRYIDDAETARAVQRHVEALPVLRGATAEETAQRDRAWQAAHKHRFKLLRPRHVLGPQSAQALEYDSYGNVVSPFLTEAARWKRYNAVVQKLRTLPPRAAEGYDVWVRVGLALHNFSNEDHVFEEWVRFSLKSPQKYSREVCRKKWVQFERNPDALNWRRGFNYLNSTVWRQV